MAVKNTILGGTDFVDGNVLSAVNQNDTFDAALLQHIVSDQTGGNITNSTTETEIGEAEVPANKISTGVLVIATGTCGADNATAFTSTIKLYGGTNATATSNTLFKTITRYVIANVVNSVHWTIVYWVTGLTWSSLNYINITGKNSNAEAGDTTFCESIVVLGK